MSETILKIIPTDPIHIPDSVSMDKCKLYLETLFDANQIEFLETEHIEFIDPGQNFENVFCNICGREINLDYWARKVDSASINTFNDLAFLAPCCGSPTSLNSLRYEWPAGFARFSILILNPNVEFTDNALQELEAIINSSLRKIWAHY